MLAEVLGLTAGLGVRHMQFGHWAAIIVAVGLTFIFARTATGAMLAGKIGLS